MIETIEQICAETHNYFESDKVIADYTIENGVISLPFLSAGQFFRIVGSKFNDGVYIYADNFIVRDASWDDVMNDNENWHDIANETWGNLKHNELIDESFHGAIWPMCIPRAFIELAKEINEYNKSDAAKVSPYTNESISGHYSYTKASATDNAWQNVFMPKLRRYRKAANV